MLAGEPSRRDDRDGCRATREEPVDGHVAGGLDRGGSELSLLGGPECGSLVVVAFYLGELRGLGERREIRVLRRRVGGFAGPERERAEALIVDPVARGSADTVPADDAQEQTHVLDQGRLMHLRPGEASETRALGLDDRLDAVALRRRNGPLRKLERALHEGATPTWTFRNRAGAAP